MIEISSPDVDGGQTIKVDGVLRYAIHRVDGVHAVRWIASPAAHAGRRTVTHDRAVAFEAAVTGAAEWLD